LSLTVNSRIYIATLTYRLDTARGLYGIETYEQIWNTSSQQKIRGAGIAQSLAWCKEFERFFDSTEFIAPMRTTD
jgi:hypothetical protein